MSQVTVLGSVMSRPNTTEWEPLAPSARQLLSIMVAAGPDGLSFERVADELWQDELPATWDASLRMALARLRKRLPTGSLISKARWCRLDMSVDEVDIWHLTALAERTGVDLRADELVAALSHEAFPSVEISPIIRDAIAEFDLLRLVLLDRLLHQGAKVSPLVAARLNSFAVGRDWDPALAERAAHISDTSSVASPARFASTIATELPTSLARQRAQHLLGRDDVIARLRALVTASDRAVVMVEAEPKSGKSATLAEVGAQLASSGWRVVHLSPSTPTAAFGPFLQALPNLRAPLIESLTSGAPDAQIRSRCWVTILQAIDHPELSTCLIVDDIDLLDSDSQQALTFITRSETANPVAVLMAADPTSDTAEWADATRVRLDHLSLEALWQIITQVHPRSADLQRLQLSKQITSLAGGLAGYSWELANAADATTLTLPPLFVPASETATPIDLSPDVLSVAVAASIIRSTISLAALEHVTRSEPHRILTAVDELLGIGVLTETSRPDVFELATAHQRSDFSAALATHEVARFSRCAMELVDRSPIARAGDALRARPLITDAEAIDALLAAAGPLVASQNHREAVAHLQAARELGAEFSAETLVVYATSLELTGADATEVRHQAIESALAEGKSAVALEAALAGLPTAESVDGDEGRMRLIESIEPSGLNRADQVRRHLALSRQLLLLSRPVAATQQAIAAEQLAETTEEKADAWLTSAHINGWRPAGDRSNGFQVARFPLINDVVDQSRRARLHQASAVSALIAGDFIVAEDEIAQLERAATDSADPLRIWHAMLLRTAVLTNRLRFSEAEQTADDASDLGVSSGLGGAVASRLAQRSSRATLLGDTNDVLSRFERATPSAMRSHLAQAAAATQLARAGRHDVAIELAEKVLMASADSRFETSVAGALSFAVKDSVPVIGARITGILEPFRGTLLVAGAGVTMQGPIESHLANVAPDPSASCALRYDAVELADSWDSPLWQIITRIELSRAHGAAGETRLERSWLAEAAERADGTEFAAHEQWHLFDS